MRVRWLCTLAVVSCVGAGGGPVAVGVPAGFHGVAILAGPARPPGAATADLAAQIEAARRRGARYVVVPWPPPLEGPGLEGRLGDLAEPVPGPTTRTFGALARRFGLWLAISLIEADGAERFLTTVLLNERGEIGQQQRATMPPEGLRGYLGRGEYRTAVESFEAGGVRLGIASAGDVRVHVPRLADRGAETVLVPAGWSTPEEEERNRSLCEELSREYDLNIVIALPSGGGVVFARGGAPVRLTPVRPDEPHVAALPGTDRWIQSSLGLPESVPVPSRNRGNARWAEVGRTLFLDRNLSSDKQVACASCHRPESAFTNALPRGVGVEGRRTRRNVPSLLNVAFRPLLQWDGYASSLENFAKYPISGQSEMNFHFLDEAVAYLRNDPHYAAAFRELGIETIEFEHAARALAAYQRTLISGRSRFDRYYYGGEAHALNARERRGLSLFLGRAACGSCHLVGDDYALLTDMHFHKLGVGLDRARGRYDDLGVGGISTADLNGHFQTPSLRNVASTAPYMHDGSLATLSDVVAFFDRGGVGAPGSPLRPLHLRESEKLDLVAFLEALTGEELYDANGRRSVEGDAR